MMPARKLRVGVTLFLRDATQSMWDSGVPQACVFLARLLNASPVVEEAVIVAFGDAATPSPGLMLDHAGVRCIGLEDAMNTLDVVIECGALLQREWCDAFRARGGRAVGMRVANEYVAAAERAMFAKPAALAPEDGKFHAVWTLPQYEHIAADYFAIAARAPVRIVPQLWTPMFVEMAAAALPEGKRFGYQPGSPRWRVCTFEPNESMVRTSFIPMLACEVAYRRRPGFLDNFKICNTLHLRDQPQFVQFARSLDVVQHGVATSEGRFPFYEFMANYGDCVVAHQWENAQAYLYYEALYGGYPLVHNSPTLRGCGYYYPGFDCEAAGEALLAAHSEHDRRMEETAHKLKALLESLDTASPANIEVYTRELKRLYEP